MTSEICDDCINADGCDLPCAAYKELYSIWREQKPDILGAGGG